MGHERYLRVCEVCGGKDCNPSFHQKDYESDNYQEWLEANSKLESYAVQAMKGKERLSKDEFFKFLDSPITPKEKITKEKLNKLLEAAEILFEQERDYGEE